MKFWTLLTHQSLRLYNKLGHKLNGIYQPVYWINAFNSGAGAVTLADLLALRDYEQSKPNVEPDF